MRTIKGDGYAITIQSCYEYKFKTTYAHQFWSYEMNTRKHINSNRRNRIERFYDCLIAKMSEPEIAAGIASGDIDTPEWMGVSDTTKGLRIWDGDDHNASAYWGFIFISNNNS